MNARTRSGPALAALLAPLLLAAGCGGDASPASQVPSLTQRLDAVDEAVAAHDDAATRAAINDLEQTTTAARRSGDLDRARADQVLAAAEALLKALPGADTTPSETTSTSPSSEATQPPTTQPPTTQPPTTPGTPPPPPGHDKKDKPEKPPKPDKHDGPKPDKHDGPKPKPRH